MDAKSCVIFLKAAETGSITKAALALGYTQAGVSLVVRKIEEECGFHLLIREKNGVRLTDAGARLLPIMREIARWDERFRETAAEINGVSTGTVRVGCYSSIAYHWMPRVIRAFRVNHPKIAIDILEGSVDEIERWIEERRVDVGFLSARRGQRFHTVALAQDSVLVLLPPEHPLCAAEAFPLSALGGMPFIVTDDSDAYPVVKAYEEKYGPLPDMKISSTGDATISMVACGLGVSVLPALMLRGHSAGVVVKEIAPPFFRTIIMGMRSPDELSPAARRFLDHMTQCLPELTDGGEA
ncbi:LysR family transcriptional regulator [uncultured Cloacibacillus sp.]|uniref:LysR family transcriptional regulator n=1 Tax=uncultured Cloacibacillus sp. TaxID=889794 RepID=UPI00261E9DB4|nr:LysR family transcriptional regulator [uncultured Cloacibacillus sp.]